MDAIPITPVDPSEFGTATPLWRSAFLLPEVVTPLDDGVTWRVVDTFSFESAILQRILTILQGTLTDFASTPQYSA